MSTGSGDSSYLRCSSCGRVHQVSKSDSSKERIAQMSCVQCGSTSLVAASWEEAPAAGPGDEGTVIRMKPSGQQPSGAAAPGMIGQSLAGGKYVILKLVGEGGGGVVFRAKQPALKRDVAIKLLKAEGMDQSQASRFLREARLAIRLRHPHIIETYDLFEEEGRQYLVMEYVDGTTLTSWWTSTVGSREGGLAGHRKDPATLQFLKLIVDTCDGLHYAHEEGVIHRDMKPPNVMVTKSGVGKLADFGLAREVSSQSVLTLSGTILGTPNYMSPEQAKGIRQIDRRTDVYGMGAILYWGLTGQPPFEGEGIFETLQMIIDEEVKPPTTRNPTIDRALENVMLKCLEKDPERRYGTAKDLKEELERYVKAGKVQAKAPGALRKAAGQVRRKRSLQIGIAVTATVLIVGAVAWRLLAGAAAAGERNEQMVLWQQGDESIAHTLSTQEDVAQRIDTLTAQLDGPQAGNPYLLVRRAEAYLTMGRFSEARADAARAAEAGGDMPGVLYASGRIEEFGATMRVWPDSHADERYSAAAALGSNDPHVQMGLARNRIRDGELAEALRIVTEVRSTPVGQNLLDAVLLEIEIQQRLRDPSSAMTLLLEAQRQYPDRAEIWSIQGTILLEAGELDQAIAAFEQARQKDDRNPAHLWNLAIAYGPGQPLPYRLTLEQLAELDTTGELGRNARELLERLGPAVTVPIRLTVWGEQMRSLMAQNRVLAAAQVDDRITACMASTALAELLTASFDAVYLGFYDEAQKGLAEFVDRNQTNGQAYWALARIFTHRARRETDLETRRGLLRQAFEYQQEWVTLGRPVAEVDPFPEGAEWQLIE